MSILVNKIHLSKMSKDGSVEILNSLCNGIIYIKDKGVF